MKNLKTVMLTLSCVAITTVASAQSDKMIEKAKEKTEELNADIVAGDPSLALSEEQFEKIYKLQLERLAEVKKVRKAAGSKEDMKEVNKMYVKKIFTEVLTKEQKKARRKIKKEKGE